VNPHHDPSLDPDAASDAALRTLYHDAQTHLSGATTARLHQRRHAALQSSTRRRGWGLPLAASVAAVCALAVGLQFTMPAEQAAAPNEPSVVIAQDNIDTADAVDDAVAAYDESPDFYLWLAANEATLLAAE
jgi:hypothetical protein